MRGNEDLVRRFEEAWEDPGNKFVELFAPDGTLMQAGMEKPISREQIPAHQNITLALLPDMAVKVTRWAAQGDDVFIEWASSGTFQGRCISWSGASRFTLRDGLIVEEVAYFDTLPLRAAVNPNIVAGDMASAALAATSDGSSAGA